MRALLFTTGSPFARAVRIVLDELGLDYEKREEIIPSDIEQRAASTPTLQVPTFWDDDLTLWESGTIVEYLLSTYPQRPPGEPPLAKHAFRPTAEWQDKLTFSTIQTFGNAATIISQTRLSTIKSRNGDQPLQIMVHSGRSPLSVHIHGAQSRPKKFSEAAHGGCLPSKPSLPPV